MARMAFLLHVRPGTEQAYRELHNPANLWPSIIAACRRAGMRNYTGFLGGPDGLTLFASFEADDPSAALEALNSDPANLEWQEHMAPYLDSPALFGGVGTLYLDEVFHIE